MVVRLLFMKKQYGYVALKEVSSFQSEANSAADCDLIWHPSHLHLCGAVHDGTT